MQGLLDTVEREFMVAGWKSPSAPVTDLARARQRPLSSTSFIVERSVEDSARKGRLISSPSLGAEAPSPSDAAARQSNETAPESTLALVDAVRVEGNKAYDKKGADDLHAGARRGAKRQRVPSEFDGDSGPRASPLPPCRQDKDVAPLESPSTLEENAPAQPGVARMSGARRDDHQSAGTAPPRCQYESCTKSARSPGRPFCRRHGEGRRCKASGCNKVDVGGGNCRRHGGGRRCGADGCLKTDVGGGFCVSHGGGKRCQAEGCAKGAQAGGLFCKSHGGGRRCRIAGCMTSAQSGADVLCIKHGGGKRCLVPGCRKLVRKSNRCTKHASQGSEIVAPSAGETAAATTATPSGTVDRTGEEGVPSPTPQPLPGPEKPTVEPVVPQSQASGIMSDNTLSERGALERDRAPALALHLANVGRRTGCCNPPLPSMSMIGPLPAPRATETLEGVRNIEKPVVSLKAIPPPPPSSCLTSSIDDRPTPLLPVPSLGDRVKVTVSGPLLQKSIRPTGVPCTVAAGVRLSPEAARGFQRPLPRFATIESSLNRDRAAFRSERVGNLTGSLSATVEPPQPPHVSATDPFFSLGDTALADSLSEERGSNRNVGVDVLGLCRLARPGRFRDDRDRSPPSAPLLPPPRIHSPYRLPPPSVADMMAVLTADGGGGGSNVAEGWSRHSPNEVARAEDRNGGLEDPSDASLWARAAPGALTATPPPPPLDVARAARRSIAPPPADTACGNASGLADNPLLGTSPDKGSAAIPASAQSILPPDEQSQPRFSEDCCAGDGGVAEEGFSSGSVTDAGSNGARADSPVSTSQSQTYISLSVKGMMCMESCGQTVQQALGDVPGVRSVTVHFPTRTASVQVEPGANVTVTDLTTRLEDIGFESKCIATSTSEEPTLEEAGVNAVWAIASALGLVDRGCAMAWGDPCNCGESCNCVNCPQHMKKVSHAVDLVLKAVDLSSSKNPLPSPKREPVTITTK